jgi:hypothetical protein
MASSLEQERRAFVSAAVAKGMARQEALKRFYVQTRVKELTAAGKPVDSAVRAQLRKNWESGNVKRAEFGAPKGAKTKPVAKAQGPKRTGPETKSYAGKNVRTGPESKSYTKPKATRTGAESKSYTNTERAPMGPPKEMPKRGPNVTPNMETKKPSNPKRYGPETKSYTKPGAPARKGAETKSYTKSGPPSATPNTETKKPVKKSTTRTGPESKSYTDKKGQRRGPETKSWQSRTVYKSPASRFADKYFG